LAVDNLDGNDHGAANSVSEGEWLAGGVRAFVAPGKRRPWWAGKRVRFAEVTGHRPGRLTEGPVMNTSLRVAGWGTLGFAIAFVVTFAVNATLEASPAGA